MIYICEMIAKELVVESIRKEDVETDWNGVEQLILQSIDICKVQLIEILKMILGILLKWGCRWKIIM